MTDTKTYTGGCHCGAVRFEVDLAIESLASCNCSICSRRGWLLAFGPKDKFRLLKGEGATTEYQFGKKKVHHLFCSTCGVASWGHGIGPNGPTVSINARCLDDFDVEKFSVRHFDGKHL